MQYCPVLVVPPALESLEKGNTMAFGSLFKRPHYLPVGQRIADRSISPCRYLPASEAMQC